ncbi:pilus assembly protein TadG-related protein [Quadrisphaera sp. KR29]|uniref:pilus assembly protein TadG-related protein n=1 Tax=Quadrisphaera sp. KR29 TaxID=3461391 RepID=UPI00404444CD
MTPLVVVDAVVVTALVLVGAAATELHLARTHLLSVADSAALDAADALDEEAYYRAGVLPGQGVPLDDAGVRRSAAALLARTPQPSDLVGLAVVEPTGSPDGLTAEVTLAAAVRPALVPAWVGDGVVVPLQVTSRAREGLVLP